MTYTCKICGKTDIKGLKLHVLKKHNITMEFYDKFVNDVKNEDIIKPTEIIEISEQDIKLDETETESPDKPETTLSDVLMEFEISEIELYNILRKAIYGSNKKMAEIIVKKESDAFKIATELVANNDNEIQVKNVHIAEALQKSFGFICEQVVGKEIGNVLEKTWIMKK